MVDYHNERTRKCDHNYVSLHFAVSLHDTSLHVTSHYITPHDITSHHFTTPHDMARHGTTCRGEHSEALSLPLHPVPPVGVVRWPGEYSRTVVRAMTVRAILYCP